MERYLSAPDDADNFFAHDEIIALTRKQYAARQIFPMFSGSAFDPKRVAALLSFAVSVMRPADSDPDGELSALVYRIEHHPSLGRLAHVRMFGGRLSVRDEIKIPTAMKQAPSKI